MVDTKKEQEREELHRAIWAIADDLRGAVDGWDFKSYVLGTMFYRYISENIASYINQGEIDAGNPDFRIVFFHFNIVNVPLLVHHGVFSEKDTLFLYTILVKRTTAFP